MDTQSDYNGRVEIETAKDAFGDDSSGVWIRVVNSDPCQEHNWAHVSLGDAIMLKADLDRAIERAGE